MPSFSTHLDCCIRNVLPEDAPAPINHQSFVHYSSLARSVTSDGEAKSFHLILIELQFEIITQNDNTLWFINHIK